MSINAWGRGRSRAGKLHVSVGKGVSRHDAICGAMSVRCVQAQDAHVADCKTCVRMMAARTTVVVS